MKEILILIFVFVLTLIFYALRVWDLKSISYAVDQSLVSPHIIDISKQEWMTDESGMVETTPKVQKIPKVIIQTNTDNLVWESLYLSAKNIQWYNPEYQYLYFDDNRMLDFLFEHYSLSFVQAYQTLIPGAYRSDVFRAAYLYKKGGVYFDTGFTCLTPLRNIIRENDIFICPEDNHQTNLTRGKCYLHNAFIASIPGHRILKQYLDLVIANIEHKNYSSDVLSITGPGALGSVFYELYLKEYYGNTFPRVIPTSEGTLRILQSTFYHPLKTAIIAESDNYMITEPYFYTKTLSYREEQKRYAMPRYGAYYKHKQVFGEPGPLPTRYKMEEETNVHFTLPEYRWFALSYVKNEDRCCKTLPREISPIIKSQTMNRNIIIPTMDDMTWDQYHGIMTFVYLNPEYHFYFQEPPPHIDGWRFKVGDVCMIPFREFLNSDTMSLASIDISSSSLKITNRKCLSDGLEFGGVPDRCLIKFENI